jgi:hypothetical protein
LPYIFELRCFALGRCSRFPSYIISEVQISPFLQSLVTVMHSYFITLWRACIKIILCQAQIKSNKKNVLPSARIVDVTSLMRQNESTSEGYLQVSIKYMIRYDIRYIIWYDTIYDMIWYVIRYDIWYDIRYMIYIWYMIRYMIHMIYDSIYDMIRYIC